MTINYYSRHRDLNTGPADLQSDALPLSYVCALEDVAFIIINIITPLLLTSLIAAKEISKVTMTLCI